MFMGANYSTGAVFHATPAPMLLSAIPPTVAHSVALLAGGVIFFRGVLLVS